MCQARVRGMARPTHELEDDITALPGYVTENSCDEDGRSALEPLKKEGMLEDEEMFEVNQPWAPGEHIAVISWDYARHMSIPQKDFERMQQHFASILGYNDYLFGIVDEDTTKQHNFSYGQEHESKGTSTVLVLFITTCSIMHAKRRKQLRAW